MRVYICDVFGLKFALYQAMLRTCKILILIHLLLATAAWAQDRTRERVLLLGSSSMANWRESLREDFPTFEMIDKGVGGTTYRWLMDRGFYEAAKYRPDRIVLYSGDNDIASGDTPETIARNLTRTVQLIRAQLPGVPIYVMSIKAGPGRWHFVNKVQETNQRIFEATRKMQGVGYIDIFSKMVDANHKPVLKFYDPEDWMRIHLSREGYRMWAEQVKLAFEGKFSRPPRISFFTCDGILLF